ncbi:hypothetical protein Goklo_025488 [Gossypium klotzschianum]|uniref:Uncharacterized protein n=1 Tax=Gossypium klotzschianum TaxID=34286 RepID=A0A7J8WDX0_9ROSI|nr:hypothetical protein [Gossypium klotzschianum]
MVGRSEGDYGEVRLCLEPAAPGTEVIAGGAVQHFDVDAFIGKQYQRKNRKGDGCQYEIKSSFERLLKNEGFPWKSCESDVHGFNFTITFILLSNVSIQYNSLYSQELEDLPFILILADSLYNQVPFSGNRLLVVDSKT